MITAATLFSGIGAPETAMPSWDWLWSAEIEKFPAAVLAERHPESTNLGDVTADDFAKRAAIVGRPDVLVFGSPCQDFSVAGRRAGLAGKRGNLSMVALDILGELRPRWFVFENVPGLLSIDAGRGFQWFLGRVDEIRYSLAWAVLDAQFFGLAQRRERVFAVGCLGDWRGPAAILLEPESLRGHSPPRREAGASTAGTIGSGSPRCGQRVGADEAAAGQLVSAALKAKANSSHDDSHETYVAHALNAKGGGGQIDGESETFVTHALRAEGFDAGEDGTGRGTPIVPISFDHQVSGSERTYIHDQPGRTRALTANKTLAVAFSCKDHGADAGELAPTLRSMGHVAVAFDNYNMRAGHPTSGAMSGGGAGNRMPQALLGSGVRRLTPRECERLQGFPDDYTLITYRNKPAADGPRYKALGNSMPVPVMRWILSRIEILSGYGPLAEEIE